RHLHQDLGVLVIASGYHDGVDVFEGEQLLGVFEGARLAAEFFLHVGGGFLAVVGPEVADTGDLDIHVTGGRLRHAPVAAAASAAADQADRDAVVGANHARSGSGAQSPRGGGAEETAPSEV